MWDGMVALTLIYPHTTSDLKWLGVRSYYKWKRRATSLLSGMRIRLLSGFPFPGLIGQQMALDDYLQYIRQEALAAPRRSSARGPRKIRQPSLWSERA